MLPCYDSLKNRLFSDVMSTTNSVTGVLRGLRSISVLHLLRLSSQGWRWKLLKLTTTTDEHLGTGLPTFAALTFDSAYNVHPFHNLTEDHMLAVEPCRLRRTQEELGATVG